MGKDKAPGPGAGGGQPAASPAKPPELPANLPQDLRDFVECRATSVTLKDGVQTWVNLPDEVKGFVPKDTKPELRIEAGATPGTATITVSLGVLKLSLPATIKDGRLSVDTNALPFFAPASIAKDLTAFVDALNAWFKANGMGLAPPAFGAGQTSLSKVPLGPPATATPPPPPVIVPPPGAGAGSAVYGSDMPTASVKPEEKYYEPKYVEQPPLPKAEMFPPGGPTPKASFVQGGPVVGAGGPGGAKAPAGLGGLAWKYVVLVAVVAALGLGAFIILGGGTGAPVATLPPSPGASQAGPGETEVPTAQPTVAVSVAPAVIFAPFEITGDQQVDHCEHIYTVVFTITDANGQSDIYAGRTAIYRLLDNEADRTGTIGAGGKLEATVDEHFQKSGSSCFSHLQPKVISVDGQPTF